jgi:hypothetical protein
MNTPTHTDPDLTALDARLRREAGYPQDWQPGDPTPPPKVDARTLTPDEYRKAKAAWTSYAGKVDRIRAERAAMARIAGRPIHKPKATP